MVGVGCLGFFWAFCMNNKGQFHTQHKPQVLVVLWDRIELHANNTFHNLLNRKEDYLCSGCSPYSHPASCLNDEKFQQTTDSKQPSAETEHENGNSNQRDTKAMSTSQGAGHHPLPSHLHSQECPTQLGTPREFQARSGLEHVKNTKYQHVVLRTLH